MRGNRKGKGIVLTRVPAEELRECSSVWLSQVCGPGPDLIGGRVRGTCDFPRDLLTRPWKAGLRV